MAYLIESIITTNVLFFILYSSLCMVQLRRKLMVNAFRFIYLHSQLSLNNRKYTHQNSSAMIPPIFPLSVRHCVFLHLHDLLKRHNRASFAFIIYKHLRQLLFIITGYTVRKYMNVISIFSHIKAGRFDTGRSIRPNNIKVGNTMLLNKSSKCFAGQGVAL